MKKDNMYSFVDIRWNPLGGECPHKCSYCSSQRYMRYPAFKAKYTGQPRIFEKELKNLGNGNMVFVCSQNDLFAKEIPDGGMMLENLYTQVFTWAGLLQKESITKIITNKKTIIK